MAEISQVREDNPYTEYEHEDWPLKPVALVYLGLLCLLVIAPLILMWVYSRDRCRMSAAGLRFTRRHRSCRSIRQQDLIRFRLSEENRLNNYYWIDKQKGIVHIPIEQAMKKLAAQGIDGFPKEAAVRQRCCRACASHHRGLPCAGDHALAYSQDDLAAFAFQPHPGALLPLSAQPRRRNGRSVTLGDFFTGKPVIVVLDYLRCKSLCGVTLTGIFAALDALPLDAGRDFQMLAISIDPRDTPADNTTGESEIPRGLSACRSAAEGVHFLTGAAASVRQIADAIGFPYRYDPDIDQYIHPAGFILAEPRWQDQPLYFRGGAASADLRVGLAGAAQGETLTPFERLDLAVPHRGGAARPFHGAGHGGVDGRQYRRRRHGFFHRCRHHPTPAPGLGHNVPLDSVLAAHRRC